MIENKDSGSRNLNTNSNNTLYVVIKRQESA